MNVDRKHKFIRKIATDTAKTNDSLHFECVLDPSNTSQDVYADPGYPSKGREAWLKENGYRSQIKRRGHKRNPLSEAQMQRNHRIAKSRARVEHVFAGIEQMVGKFLRTIGQARANFVMTMMATCYNMKRLAYFDRVGITAFYRSKSAESPEKGATGAERTRILTENDHQFIKKRPEMAGGGLF